MPRDEHGHIAISKLNLSRLFSDLVAKEYTKQTGKKRKITGVQLGYECRCARPQAFDVMLGSQLGVGAYRALVEKRLDGVMVSVSGQLELNYVPFSQLVDPATLVTVVRYIEPGSDFHRLARFLETYVTDCSQAYGRHRGCRGRRRCAKTQEHRKREPDNLLCPPRRENGKAESLGGCQPAWANWRSAHDLGGGDTIETGCHLCSLTAHWRNVCG